MNVVQSDRNPTHIIHVHMRGRDPPSGYTGQIFRNENSCRILLLNMHIRYLSALLAYGPLDMYKNGILPERACVFFPAGHCLDFSC
jgi:hypothetical protein